MSRHLFAIRYFLPVLTFALVFSAGFATAANTSRGDRMIQSYFAAETARLADACTPGTKSLDQWKAKQKKMRQQFFEMLGLDPLPEKTDLKATVTGTIERDGIVVEKLHFQSRPGLYVTANLYRPAKIEKDKDQKIKKLPTILYLCGHGKEKKGDISYGNKTHYQHHGVWFAKNGYVCLMLDSLQLGEIEGIHHGTKWLDRWWWNNRGYTPAGVEAWNCIRALDYLETRPEVDTNRIGATGRSGGGSYSWTIAALDERIKAAAPVAGITDLQNHVVDGVIRSHCDCMFFINTYRWDFPDVASLIAPRRLLHCNTDRDQIFPLDGVVRTYNKACDVYRLYKGKEKNVELVITTGPHADSQPLRVPVFAWFNKHFKNDESLIESPAKNIFTREELRVFDKLPEDQINTKIDETFVARDEFKYPRGNIAALRKDVKQTLLEKVFRGWPTKPCDLDIKKISEKTVGEHTITTYEFTSQHHIRLPLYVVAPAGVTREAIDTIDVRLIDQEEWSSLKKELLVDGSATKAEEKAEAKKADTPTALVRVFVPTRGIGPTRWTDNKKERIEIRRRFMLLGQTLDGMRVWDARRALQTVRKIFDIASDTKSPRLTLSGGDNFGVIACYATFFEPRVTAVGLPESVPANRIYQPIFLNNYRCLHPTFVMYFLAGKNYLCCPKVTSLSAPTWVYAKPGVQPEGIGICRSNYVRLTCRDKNIGSLPARLRFPRDIEHSSASTGPYPLLVFLHGAGERGDDSVKQLTHGSRFMSKAAYRHNCFVFAPQCPLKKTWACRHWKEKEKTLTEKPSVPLQMVKKTIDTLCEQYPIDRDRIYIMGLSMGGYGTWESTQRWPETFAAAVPICGGGDPTAVEQFKKHKLPIWAFHGGADPVVPVQKSHEMVEAFKKAGLDVKYTEYPGVGHNSWDNAFAEPGLLEWITSQHRPKTK